MSRYTVMVIPETANTTKQFKISYGIVKFLAVAGIASIGVLAYFATDYIQLRHAKSQLDLVVSENEGLKGEARLLMKNLEQVKRVLNNVQDYHTKLSRLTNFKVAQVSQKTGIGPLTDEEFKKARQNGDDKSARGYMPLGINLDQLTFKPVFNNLSEIGGQAQQNAIEMQQLLSSLSQKKSLLAAIPSITPTKGWITSRFGPRISPFTGRRTMHKGIDIAASHGTVIHAPGDGVVIYSGKKTGYGNYIMIAHGYGIVTGFAHNAQNMVHPGQKVKRGDQIGIVGSTGRSTGPHLHYEVIVNGKHQNPSKFTLH